MKYRYILRNVLCNISMIYLIIFFGCVNWSGVGLSGWVNKWEWGWFEWGEPLQRPFLLETAYFTSKQNRETDVKI